MEKHNWQFCSFYTFIVDKSAIMIQPNKRNKRKQTLHLKMARSNLDIMNEDNGYCLQGRPDKKDIVLEFRKQYPNSTKAAYTSERGVNVNDK